LPADPVARASEPSGIRTEGMPPCMSAIITGAPQVMLRSGSNCSGWLKLP
jgi:hypothetical protein